jgi:DNA polymerase I-like protein with 3'-5' exonuclease and polymerase domains
MGAMPPVEGVLVRSLEQSFSVLQRMREYRTKRVIYDVETTGLDWRRDMVVGHVITLGPAPTDTFYIPVRHGPDYRQGNITEWPVRDDHPFELELGNIMAQRRDVHWIGHHFTFDLMMLHGHGIHVTGTCEDTEVNDALLDEFADSHSLEASCEHAGTRPKKGTALYKYMADKFGGEATRRVQMGNYWKLPGDDPVGVDYAMGDGISTWALYEKQIKACEDQGITLIRQLEARVTRATYRMMRRGVRIDMDRLNKLIVDIGHKIEEAQKALPEGLNINSPPQLAKYFMSLGVPEEEFDRTEKGNPSFDEEWLKKRPAGKPVLVVRKYKNLLNTFAIPLRDRHTYKGRVHATFHQMANDDFGTVTGRFSCSDPNLQQVPKRNKEIAQLFRAVFLPDEGLDWIDADLSQCEPRLLAHYSGSRVLTAGYTSKPSVDAHTAVANAAGIDRESGKRLNQTIITGGGKAKLISMLGPSGAKIYDDYFRAMPEVKRLQKEASARMARRGFVKSLLGRRARLESSSKSYLAINRLLQCGNADIIKKGMVEIDEMFEANDDCCALLNTVHDALGMQGAMGNPEHQKIIHEALRIMTDFGPEGQSVFLSVPMQADYGIGKNWAEATFPTEKLIFG